MCRILVAESAGFAPQAADILRGLGDVTLADLTRGGLIAAVGDADVLWVRLRHRIDAEVMRVGERLRVIVSPTTGLNHIDLAEADRRGIHVLALRGETAFLNDVVGTAEHTLALILALLRRLPAHLAQDGVTALVFNFIDQLTHGRTENSTLYEVARDTSALRNLTRTWFERSPLWDALREAERRGVPVLLTTDHGSIHCHTPATVFAKRDTTSNLRYKFGDDLRAQEADAALVVDDLPSFGLPARSPGTRLLLATGDRFFVYPTKLREYQARYRGAFLHGGVSPEEVILPIALLTPRHA